MNKLGIIGIDYIEFYVGNLFQACFFYKNALGFTPIAHTENLIKNENSILLIQNNIYILLTSALTPYSAVAQHVNEHGDGIKDIALGVENAAFAFDTAIRDGATAILEPITIENNNCKIIKATIATFGDTYHSFIQRFEKTDNFLPSFRLYNHLPKNHGVGLKAIDHVAACIEQGSLLRWKDFYQNILGFHESHHENIHTGKSGMNSYALQATDIKPNFSVVLVEPTNGIKKSQIKEFLDFYKTAGVQHLAFLCDDIVYSIQTLLDNEISFLSIPSTYYDDLSKNLDVTAIPINYEILKKNQILIDRDKNGYLLQKFSKVIQTRPTFFIELIQRFGSKGFGSGNIKALFQAIEKEQMLREII